MAVEYVDMKDAVRQFVQDITGKTTDPYTQWLAKAAEDWIYGQKTQTIDDPPDIKV